MSNLKPENKLTSEQVTAPNPETPIEVVVPYQSVHAVETTRGAIVEIEEGFRAMSRTEKRRFAKHIKRQKKVLKKGDNMLLDLQNEFNDGEYDHHEAQIEFNQQVLEIELFEGVTDVKDIAILVEPSEITTH